MARSNQRNGAIQATWNLLAAERGASTIEQALFIALVIGAALAGVEGLGLVGDSTFRKVATGMSSSDVDGPPNRSGSDNASATAATETRAQLAAENSVVLSPRLLVLLIACPFGAACWYLLYRDSRKKTREKDEIVEAPTATASEDDAMFSKRHDLLRKFSGDVGMLFTSRMRVDQVMTRNVLRVEPNTPIADVRWQMAERKIRHLLVCDKHERLLGVISDRDIHLAQAKVARDVMSQRPVTVAGDSLVNPAVTLLLQKRISCLPVVEGERVIGVVTSTDLLMALQCTLHALQRVAVEAVADLPPDTVPGFMLAAQLEFQSAQESESLLAANS